MESKKCKYCNKEFYKKDFPKCFNRMITCGRKECKDKLRKEWTYSKSCPDCDKPIVYSANKCHSCASKGKNNPFYGKTHTEESKKKIKLFKKGEPSLRKGKKLTEKQKLKISINRKGKCCGVNHPNWNNGSSFEPYGVEFNNQLREQIRKRYNYRCQECFRHQNELFTKLGKKRKLVVHHIDFDKQNNNPNNLIPLCLNCHMKTNFNREHWIEYFQKKGGYNK